MAQLAIRGGTPVRAKDYPAWPIWDQREIDAVTDVIRSGQWGGFPEPGPHAAAFATAFAAYQSAKHGICIVNGTFTLIVALRAAGITLGDEVIVPAYTFAATAYAPLEVGAIPVIVDIDPNTYCMDPKAIEAAITPRTRAIMPVHVGSQMADMDAIMALAEKYNLIVVEDCAHAHGAKWRHRDRAEVDDGAGRERLDRQFVAVRRRSSRRAGRVERLARPELPRLLAPAEHPERDRLLEGRQRRLERRHPLDHGRGPGARR
jgi:hypothetical protein